MAITTSAGFGAARARVAPRSSEMTRDPTDGEAQEAQPSEEVLVHADEEGEARHGDGELLAGGRLERAGHKVDRPFEGDARPAPAEALVHEHAFAPPALPDAARVELLVVAPAALAQQREVADNALAVHLVRAAVGLPEDPVARVELRRLEAALSGRQVPLLSGRDEGEPDRVGEGGHLGRVQCGGGDADAAGDAAHVLLARLREEADADAARFGGLEGRREVHAALEAAAELVEPEEQVAPARRTGRHDPQQPQVSRRHNLPRLEVRRRRDRAKQQIARGEVRHEQARRAVHRHAGGDDEEPLRQATLRAQEARPRRNERERQQAEAGKVAVRREAAAQTEALVLPPRGVRVPPARRGVQSLAQVWVDKVAELAQRCNCVRGHSLPVVDCAEEPVREERLGGLQTLEPEPRDKQLPLGRARRRSERRLRACRPSSPSRETNSCHSVALAGGPSVAFASGSAAPAQRLTRPHASRALCQSGASVARAAAGGWEAPNVRAVKSVQWRAASTKEAHAPPLGSVLLSSPKLALHSPRHTSSSNASVRQREQAAAERPSAAAAR
eukprot:CAMPEP_0185532294 /NCGR_PEP_ID=MMETSP1366-20130426/107874_1 /TAXON_ID=38817 /ORGANISM="Gephyrocapsa oceanica, Strain RCC1303" /LENGTH=559 /DNA_ID=CAMNT_0028144017 /DNA_START=259 /DNA_END=1939 /DNA_ORIENTATION=-